MAYSVKTPASQLFADGRKVGLPAFSFDPSGTELPWTVSTSTQDEVRFVGPTGYGTPTTLVLHSNVINDWYASKNWVDASAIPPVRSATRVNATYTENMSLVDDQNNLDTKVLPCQVSLNVTIPNVDNLTTDHVYNLLERALGAICSAHKAPEGQTDISYLNIVDRLHGVLKPKQFSNN